MSPTGGLPFLSRIQSGKKGRHEYSVYAAFELKNVDVVFDIQDAQQEPSLGIQVYRPNIKSRCIAGEDEFGPTPGRDVEDIFGAAGGEQP